MQCLNPDLCTFQSNSVHTYVVLNNVPRIINGVTIPLIGDAKASPGISIIERKTI